MNIKFKPMKTLINRPLIVIDNQLTYGSNALAYTIDNDIYDYFNFCFGDDGNYTIKFHVKLDVISKQYFENNRWNLSVYKEIERIQNLLNNIGGKYYGHDYRFKIINDKIHIIEGLNSNLLFLPQCTLEELSKILKIEMVPFVWAGQYTFVINFIFFKPTIILRYE